MRYSRRSDRSNYFGPGTDLIVSLVAVLLVVLLIGYNYFSVQLDVSNEELELARRMIDDLTPEEGDGGNFKIAEEQFDVGLFRLNPVDSLVDVEQTRELAKSVAQRYLEEIDTYPYMFVIGHTNAIDIDYEKTEEGVNVDTTYRAKLHRNWVFGARRSAVIASLIQGYLREDLRNNIIVTSTGQFDMRRRDSTDQENAWVEIVFARDWKIPAAGERRVE